MVHGNFWKSLESMFRDAPAVEGSATPSATAPPSPIDLATFKDRIPAAARERVDRIVATIATLERRLDREPGRVMEAIELRQMATSHLPTLLLSYIDIPAEHRAEIFRKTGRSASFMLIDQLDRVIAHLNDLSRAVAQDDIDTFSTNIRFMGERYGNDPFAID